MSTLSIISYICLGLGVIGIGLSVFLWFKLRILKVWNAYTGRTQKRELEELKQNKRARIAKGRAVQQKDADQDRASAEEVNQLWSESKVLSGTDESDTFYDDEDNETTEPLAPVVRNMSDTANYSTEALMMSEADTDLLYGSRTVVLATMEPLTMVMPEIESEVTAATKTIETVEMKESGTEELSMEEIQASVTGNQDLVSHTFVMLDEEQTMPISDDERIVR